MRLPMFPLGNVVLPGELLPLRVFEPRYRRLVLDCLAAEVAEFGVALIERGREVGGGDQRASIATVTAIRTVAPLGQGQFNMVTAGLRRASVLEWLPDDPYPLADVEEWPESSAANDAEAAAAAGAVAELSERVHELRNLVATLRRSPTARPPARVKLDDDPALAGYQLAAAVPLGPADRFRILQAPSATSRLDTLRSVLDDAEAVLRFQLSGE